MASRSRAGGGRRRVGSSARVGRDVGLVPVLGDRAADVPAPQQAVGAQPVGAVVAEPVRVAVAEQRLAQAEQRAQPSPWMPSAASPIGSGSTWASMARHVAARISRPAAAWRRSWRRTPGCGTGGAAPGDGGVVVEVHLGEGVDQRRRRCRTRTASPASRRRRAVDSWWARNWISDSPYCWPAAALCAGTTTARPAARWRRCGARRPGTGRCRGHR